MFSDAIGSSSARTIGEVGGERPRSKARPAASKFRPQITDSSDEGWFRVFDDDQCQVRNSASIGEGEWKRVFAEDQYQRALVELNSAFYADYGRQLDVVSLAGLSRFLKRTVMRVNPTMGAESTGRVIATWRIGEEALSVEFLDKFKLKFALTARSEEGLERRWGLGHAVSLVQSEPLAARFVV